MLPPTHGCLSYLFTRLGVTKWKTKGNLLFTLGAIFPDLPSLIFGAWESLEYIVRNLQEDPGAFKLQGKAGVYNLMAQSPNSKAITTIYSELGTYRFVNYLHDCFHSLLVWLVIIAIAIIIAKKFRIGKYIAQFAAGALIFHVLTDWLTHTAHANRLFWPISEHRPWGFLSHDSPTLLSIEISLWSLTLLVFIYGFIKKIRFANSEIISLNLNAGSNH